MALAWRDLALGGAIAVAIGAAIWPREPVLAEEAERPEFLVQAVPMTPSGALIAVLHTRTEVLSVYEAQGGARSTRGLELVGARKVARDAYVTGYNDRSEYSYQDLVNRLLDAERQRRQEAGTDANPAGAPKDQ